MKIGGVIMAIVFGTLAPADIAAPLASSGNGRAVEVRAERAIRFGYVRMKSGMRLHYAEQGPPRGPAVVLLHGFTDSWFSFSRILPLLPPDVRVIAPDQRGHGLSDRPADYSIPDFAADIVELMDTLQVPTGTIVGHSMGSFVAREVTRRAPDRVTGLVLMGSGPVPRNDGLVALQKEVAGLTDPVDLAFVRAFQESCVARPMPEDFMRRVVAESRQVPARVWRAALNGMMAYTPAPPPADLRVLMLSGDRDSVFSVAEQQELARALPGATIHVAEGVGHTPHWETPEDVVSRLMTFVGTAGVQ